MATPQYIYFSEIRDQDSFRWDRFSIHGHSQDAYEEYRKRVYDVRSSNQPDTLRLCKGIIDPNTNEILIMYILEFSSPM